MIDAILFLTLAITGSDDVIEPPEPTCVTAAWLMPGPWVEDSPSWPQDLIGFEARECGDLTWPTPACGTSIQVDSYWADDTTTALLTPGRVLYGPSNPAESLWDGRPAWAFVYGGDCVEPTPTPTPTDPPNVCDLYLEDGTCVAVDHICPDGEELSNGVCAPADEACPGLVNCEPVEELAYTGSDDVPLFLFGILLLCVGVFIVTASKLSRMKNPDPQRKRTTYEGVNR